MVVLTVAIMSRAKPLIARQFVEMTRIRVDGLLSAFIKLIESGSKDHTYIETDSVRYIYQPMETLYILLITNKQSNILQDLETLRLLAQIVQDTCEVTVSEEVVLQQAFNIVFCFDEVLSFGYREGATLSQIRTFLLMDSHEAKLQRIIRENKEKYEKERRKQYAKQLDKERSRKKPEEPDFQMVSNMTIEDPLEQYASGATSTYQTPYEAPSDTVNAPYVNGTGAGRKGMQLGKKNATGDVFEVLREKAAAALSATASAAAEETLEEAPPVQSVNPLTEVVSILIEEKIFGQLHAEGAVEDIDIQGTFQVTVNDQNKGRLATFKITPEDKRFKYKVHPNMNKSSHTEGILAVRDPTKAFRVNSPTPLMKWRRQTKEEDTLPLSVSCWPSTASDRTTVTLEVELARHQLSLQDIHCSFMCPQSAQPQVINIDGGEVTTDEVSLHWKIPFMDSTISSGTLEFTVRTDVSTLFPFSIEAVSPDTACNIDVLECYDLESKSALSKVLSKMAIYNFTVGV